jgi:anti-sigma factor RsiW
VSREREDLLMRYLDGDTDAAESADVEAWLASSEHARSLLADLEHVGDAVRGLAHSDGGGADRIADSVMARLDAETEARPLAAVPGGLGPRLPRATGRHPGGRWLALGPALGLAVAAAAAAVVYLRPAPRPERGAVAPVVSVVGPSAAALPASAAPLDETEAVPSEPGASIESVDFGARNGSIFMVSRGSGSGESETPVIWLMDDPPPTGHRMDPL